MIEAKVVADSISPEGIRLVTVEGTLHRWVLAELSKHRLLSISAQSSRAVPVAKMIEQVRDNPAMPIHWGKKQKGMRADEECNNVVHLPDHFFGTQTREDAWEEAADAAARIAEEFDKAGYHKQIVNRLIEPFLWQKVVITATEWENLFRLRIHPDAQPELRAFVEKVKEVIDNSEPQEIGYQQYHVPYVETWTEFTREIDEFGEAVEAPMYLIEGEGMVGCYDAIRYSAARCATTSYRSETLSLEKALKIYSYLVESDPWHAVPLEHVARPLEPISDCLTTHVDRKDNHWSGNFRGWAQYRKEVTGNVLDR